MNEHNFWHQNNSKYTPQCPDNHQNEGQEDDNFDTASVASMDVPAYQRHPAPHQPNRFQNIRHRAHYLQPQQQRGFRGDNNYGSGYNGGGSRSSWSSNNKSSFGYNRGKRNEYNNIRQKPNINQASRSNKYKNPNKYRTKQQPDNDPNEARFNVNVQSLSKWNVSPDVIAEVRKYGSYEFYLGNDSQYGIKVVIRYGNKLILMKNDFDDTIWGAFEGGIDDWKEWFHAYIHDSFNNKNINYFTAKFMPHTTVKFKPSICCLFVYNIILALLDLHNCF